MRLIAKQFMLDSNYKIKPVFISENELAWKLSDAFFVLRYMVEHQHIILGGDILNSELKHNYDSWYYNVDTSKDSQENSKLSYDKAVDYLQKYFERNGQNFYVVLVAQ